MARESLVAEFLAQRETVMQACWAHQLWSRRKLRTADGRPLEVIFQGWLNRGAGPDFTEARVRIGDSEIFGDVEIHTDPTNWRAHGHHKDPAYERVVLHVVLQESVKSAGKDNPAIVLGRPIPVFEVLPHMSPDSVAFMRDPGDMLRQYEQVPGRCGLRAAAGGPDAVVQVISHAAEERARQKAERLIPGWENKAEEQILFELVFQSLGYRPHGELFRQLAMRFPILELDGFLDLPPHEARDQVLSRWFGALGLLEGADPGAMPGDAAKDYSAWRRIWETAGGGRLAVKLKRGGSRPWNSPERRLVGMFHHLYSTGARGWLKSWLGLLHELDALRDQPDLKKSALAKLDGAFATPDWEPWRGMVTFSSAPMQKAARLIGRDRVIIVMANALVPFFLAYARKRGDRELEKLLYRLFIVLPPEAPNQRTRFMEKRLLVLASMPRSLRMHQGLLQIHQDFCTSFHEGCQECAFPDLISTSPNSR